MKSLGTSMFLGGFSAAASVWAPRGHRDPSLRFAQCLLQAEEQHRYPPGWAGVRLLAPFSSPQNLGCFFYSLQAPAGAALFQGIPEAGETGHAHGTSLPGEAATEGRDDWGLLNQEGLGEHG